MQQKDLEVEQASGKVFRRENMAKEKDKKVEVKKEPKPSRKAPAGMKWIAVNNSEIESYQKEAKLVGYDPKTKEALVKA